MAEFNRPEDGGGKADREPKCLLWRAVGEAAVLIQVRDRHHQAGEGCGALATKEMSLPSPS